MVGPGPQQDDEGSGEPQRGPEPAAPAVVPGVVPGVALGFIPSAVPGGAHGVPERLGLNPPPDGGQLADPADHQGGDHRDQQHRERGEGVQGQERPEEDAQHPEGDTDPTRNTAPGRPAARHGRRLGPPPGPRHSKPVVPSGA